MTEDAILNLLKERDNFILTTHESPDGDALGSEIALGLTLKYLGKSVYIVNSDPSEGRYDFITKNFASKRPAEWLKENDAAPFTLIILDTAPDNIGKSMDLLQEQCFEVLPIDHHDTLNSDKKANRGYYNSEASSTCEMVYELIEKLNVPMTLEKAESIFAGMVYDTGSFRYRKTGARTLEIASLLVKAGVVPFYIHSQIYENNTKESLVLSSSVLSTETFEFNDRVCILEMSRELLASTGAKFEEAQTLINIPLACKSVELSIFFKENEKGLKKCSLRSKGKFNCLSVAEKFGGGGHETAAGFKIKEDSFSTIRAKVLDVIRPFFT